MVEVQPETISAQCKALAHPVRVRIIELLACQAECRGADVFGELPLAQSTISQHLRILKDAGLVRSKAVGTSMVYCLDPDALDALVEALTGIAANAAASGSDEGGVCR
jgi:ArsR family transcriptional regulator